MRFTSTLCKYYIVFFFALEVCLCKGCDGCCAFVCIVRRGAVGARVWEI